MIILIIGTANQSVVSNPDEIGKAHNDKLMMTAIGTNLPKLIL